MYFKILPFISLVTLVVSHDVIVGLNTDGKKIFDENREANPAIWRQIENVTINTNGDDVIRRVVITDLRPEKDGDANIVDGGEGQKNVTIELKSPTVLRGFSFHIEVYAGPDTGNKNEDKRDDSVQNSNFHGDVSPEYKSIIPDNASKTSTIEVSSEIVPISISKDNTRTSRDTNLATGTTEAISTTESSTTTDEIKSTTDYTTGSAESTTSSAVTINSNVPSVIGIDHLEHKDTRYSRDTEEAQADSTHKPTESEKKDDGKLDLTPSITTQNTEVKANENFPQRVNVHNRYPLYTSVKVGGIEHKDNSGKTPDVPSSYVPDVTVKSENSTDEQTRNSRDTNNDAYGNPIPISGNENQNTQPENTSFNTPLNSQSTVNNEGNFGMKVPIMPNQNFGSWTPLVPKIEAIPNTEGSTIKCDEISTTESDASSTVTTFSTETTTEFTTLGSQSTEQVSSTHVVYFQ